MLSNDSNNDESTNEESGKLGEIKRSIVKPHAHKATVTLQPGERSLLRTLEHNLQM